MESFLALKVHNDDNVATLFAEVAGGSEVEIRDKKGDITPLKVSSDIPYGHKVALKDIHIGEQITKYGEEIGIATKEIKTGDHVHVHNLDSMRARGDLA